MSKKTVTRACKVVIYFIDQTTNPTEIKFLLLKRSSFTLRNRGRWDLVGGAADKNESQIEAAVREASEEISLKLDPNNLVLNSEKFFADESRIKACATYKIGSAFKPKLSVEHSKYQWMSLVELEETDLPDFYKKSCRTIKRS